MNMRLLNRLCRGLTYSWMLGAAAAQAGQPTVQQMLELKPTQRYVDYDTPSADRIPQFKADLVNDGKAKVWVLRDSAGRIYRRFIDSDRDGTVDQWVYYREGVEVYRDIDANSNGRADQFRWINAGGTRWAIDSNEDGRVDSYRVISPAEVTREVFRAVLLKDFSILEPTLAKPGDGALLGRAVAPDRLKELTARAREQFSSLVTQLGTLTAESQWGHFETPIPMMIPGDSPDGSRDVEVYRNAVAVIQTGDRTHLLQFGEILVVGRCAKITEMPTVVAPKAPMISQNAAVFSNVPPDNDASRQQGGADTELQNLLLELQKLDEQSARLAGNDQATARYHLQRSDLLQRISGRAKTEEDRIEWVKQQADSLIAAMQTGTSKEAVERLSELVDSVRHQKESAGLASYIEFRKISAEYFLSLQATGNDDTTVQKQWLEKLQAFITEYPAAEDTPDALAQLAIGMEFSGKEDTAREFYQKLCDAFPKCPLAARARGAIQRLDLVGRPLVLKGTELRNGTVDLQQFRGKIVLVDFWATTCGPWKTDLPKLKELYAKYRSKGFEIVGVNVDTDKAAVARFVQSAGITWPILFEPGGLDNPLALQYGVLALPTQFLVDDQGKVVSRTIHASQLESELQKLLK